MYIVSKEKSAETIEIESNGFHFRRMYGKVSVLIISDFDVLFVSLSA